MIVKAYLRVARQASGKPKIGVGSRPNGGSPMVDGYGDAIPTVCFAVEFVIDDAMFDQAERVIAQVYVDQPEIAATVRQVES